MSYSSSYSTHPACRRPASGPPASRLGCPTYPVFFGKSRKGGPARQRWTPLPPAGSTRDMTAAVEGQIERFAPGFCERVLARASMHSAEIETYNPNYVGGDINGGRQDLRQLFNRPVARLSPYTTPDPRLFICSSSTPPGGGVHGMCGYFAAQAALRST